MDNYDEAKYTKADEAVARLPEYLQTRIGFGLYGGYEQFYIHGVDGSLASLGGSLAPYTAATLRALVKKADKANGQLLRLKAKERKLRIKARTK